MNRALSPTHLLSRFTSRCLLPLAVVVVAATLAAGRAAAATVDELLTVQADDQQWAQDQLWCLSGNVKITYQEITIRCDEVEVDLQTMKLVANGNVIIDQAETRMSCTRLRFDLNAKVGTLDEVDAYFPPTYHFRGKELEKLDATKYRFHDGMFTSCSAENTAPPWSLAIHDAVVELEGYGHFRGASLRVKDVPVFYLPKLVWPVKRERAAGLLVPNFGYNSWRGAYLGTSFYWPGSRSFDATLYVDLYSKGYTGLGAETRWAPAENAYGQLLAYTIRDPETNSWQWKARGRHNQLFSGGYSLKAEIDELSDLDFFQRFESGFDRNALRTLYSYLTMSRVWGPQAINARIEHRRTFFTQFSTGKTTAVTLDRLPGAEYRLRSTRLGTTPLYVAATALADRFFVDRSATLRGSYARFDLFPTVSLLAPGWSWLNITPTLGARETYYTSRTSTDRQRFTDEPLSRRYVTGGLTLVGPSMSRVWTSLQRKLKHLFEPRLDYTYVSNPGDQTAIPIFDERDSILVSNQVKWTLANRLFVKKGEEGGREVASFEISQAYSFSDPLTFARPPFSANRRGLLNLWLRTSPVAGTSVDARADFDPASHRLTNTQLSGGAAIKGASLYTTWFASFDPVSSLNRASQIRTTLNLAPTSRPWRFENSLAYDLHSHTLLEQKYGFRWRGSCWSAAAEVRDYRIAPYTTRDYKITIDLTGIGNLLEIQGGLDGR